MENSQACCVVTGGRGFAARHLVLQLLESGRWSVVRIMDLAQQISLEPHEASGILGRSLTSGAAQYVSADLRDKSQVIEALKGSVAVFHMAAPDSSINSFNLHYQVSVQGTRNVIDACIHHNVRKLIYTSSPSTVFDGVHGIINGDESLPYPDRHNDIYSETKAQAEALVLAANGKSGLVTCAIRPSSIFGPGDRLLVPSLVSAAKSGKMKFILGNGENMYDFTYVENVAHAHICAEKALNPEKCYGDDVAAGKAYFITNREPMRFWEFVSRILEGLGYERPKIHLPVPLLMPIAYMVDLAYQNLPVFKAPPQFTPSRLRLVTSWRTFNCDRAMKLLGYSPIVSLEEGIKRTIDSYSHLRAEPKGLKSRGMHGVSKTHEFLGGGKVADILLWKNEKHTIGIGVAMAALIYFLFISSITVVCALSKLCLVLMAAAYFQNFLPHSLFGPERAKLSSTKCEISEHTMDTILYSLRNIWNPVWDTVEYAVHKQNWIAFTKVMLFLYFLKFLGTFAFSNLLLTGVSLAFLVFYIYDQKEEEIDNLFEACKKHITKYRHYISK